MALPYHVVARSAPALDFIGTVVENVGSGREFGLSMLLRLPISIQWRSVVLINAPYTGSKGRTMSADKPKALTVRLPSDLYKRGKTVIERRNTTLNELVIEGLAHVVAREEETALFEAFGEVGADATMADVSFSWAAQHETVCGRPPDTYAKRVDG